MSGAPPPPSPSMQRGLRFDRVCRVCLQEKKEMRPLFHQLLADMIMACASVRISEQDGLPSQLCLQCVHQVSRCYSFKQKIEQSDSQLRSYMDKNPQLAPPEELKQISQKSPLPQNDIQFQFIDNSQASVDTVTSKSTPEPFYSPQDQTEDNDVSTTQDLVTLKSENIDPSHSGDGKIDVDVPSSKEQPASDIDDESYLELATFQASVSVSPGRHICNLCQREFKHAKWLKMHMRMHSNWIKENCKKPPMCNICQRTFKGPGMLKLHMRTHEDRPQRQPTCTICNSVFKSKTILYRHRQTHFEEKTHPCNICERSFISNYALQAHIARHRGEKPHTCTTCGKSFYNTTDLKVHIRLHTGEKPLKCTECDKTFRRHSTLCQHLKKHRGIRDHVCHICNKAFFEVSKLTAHLRVHTGEKPYECNYCARRFAQQSALIYHQRTHTGEKPYPCKLCGARFTTSSARSNHLAAHSGIKKYPCTVCNKGCANRTELRIHMTKHTGEKLFPCSECDQRFSTASYLAVHRRHHTGEKKYVCSVCSKGFVDSASLKKHLKTHSNSEIEAANANANDTDNNQLEKVSMPGAKNFTCNICGKSYTQGQNLKKHMASHMATLLNPSAIEALNPIHIQHQITQTQPQPAQSQSQHQHQQHQHQHQHQQTHQIVQQPQLQVQAIQIHPQHVSAHHNQPIQIHAVGVHQVQQQQVHVAASSCQSVPLPNLVQVPPDGSCIGQQITMGQLHDQSDRLQFQNYPIQAVTNVLSGVVPQGQAAYYIVVNNSNIKKDALNSEGEILGGP